jgi:hypothetical protein
VSRPPGQHAFRCDHQVRHPARLFAHHAKLPDVNTFWHSIDDIDYAVDPT